MNPGTGNTHFSKTYRHALRPTQPPIKWVPGREIDRSPPVGAVVKNEWSYTSTPLYAFMV